ncbi:hypothetical protein CALVIDRAFT_560308 [Calocera viscosa TUFC12733]|uniref:RNA exonuclease 4 n=1 Tax=Calocera viscosa (strain TUFC12733) TaxID=1330018 RepID=A0A167RKY7_CALVF|nr:hypothetical protein CALVIDRAFT_560308 [Calocera viscosa TUFC12733]
MVKGEGVDGPPDVSATYIAIDCEMVGVEPTGASSLARVSIVDYDGQVLLDQFVKQTRKVVNYRTKWSGVRPRDLADAPSFEEVQAKVSRIMKNRIVIGHALQNDFRVLHLSYPRHYTRDTQRYQPLQQLGVGKSLKLMIKDVLGIDIQSREHDSVVDARASLALFRLHQADWEEHLSSSHFVKSPNHGLQEIVIDGLAGSKSPTLLLETPTIAIFPKGTDASSPAESHCDVPSTVPSESVMDLSRRLSQDVLTGLRIHIIPAKLTPQTLIELSRVIESHGATLTSQATAADVILTAVGAKKRLERHLDMDEAGKKLILRIDWLQETVAAGHQLPYERFLALPDTATDRT